MLGICQEVAGVVNVGEFAVMGDNREVIVGVGTKVIVLPWCFLDKIRIELVQTQDNIIPGTLCLS